MKPAGQKALQNEENLKSVLITPRSKMTFSKTLEQLCS